MHTSVKLKSTNASIYRIKVNKIKGLSVFHTFVKKNEKQVFIRIAKKGGIDPCTKSVLRRTENRKERIL